MAGRIGVYVHSDNSSPDKGGALVVIETQTDFSSRSLGIKQFADKVAMYAYGFSDMLLELQADHDGTYESVMISPWQYLAREVPDLDRDKQGLEASLKETIILRDFTFLKV